MHQRIKATFQFLAGRSTNWATPPPSNRKVARRRFDSRCGSASLCL